jgi:predicted ribosomally synthesized peptide with SipW-like signal peptide
MKKILTVFLTIGVVAGIAIYSSNAFFSDSETSSGNTFQAGKLDLKVDYSSTYNGNTSNSWELTDLTDQKFFDLTDVKPGDFGEGTISLHVDNNNAWGCVTITPTANDDNGITSPESIVDTMDGTWNGELAQNLIFRIWADTCSINAQPGDNIYQEGCDKLLTEGPAPLSEVTWPLADSTHPNIFTDSGALLGNTTYHIGAGWTLPNTVGNKVQTDSYKADISFYTEQERNNAGFLCPSTEPRINFFDDFNDGNANGWWLGYSLANPINFGNWRVENGALVQDIGHDGVLATVDGNQFSDQTLEVDLKTTNSGSYEGFILWFQDDHNYVLAFIYAADQYVRVARVVNGIEYSYNHTVPGITDGHWYNFKVEANSTNGELKVYLDGSYLFSYMAPGDVRSGRSGVMNGNGGGSFDNFKLTSN